MCNPTRLPFAADNRLVQCLQSSICSYRVHATAWTSPIFIGVLGLSGTFSPKIAHYPSGSSPPRNTLFLGPSILIIRNGISISSAVFVWVPNAMLYNALSMGKKNPRNCSFPLGFRHHAVGGLSHSHRQHT